MLLVLVISPQAPAPEATVRRIAEGGVAEVEVEHSEETVAAAVVVEEIEALQARPKARQPHRQPVHQAEATRRVGSRPDLAQRAGTMAAVLPLLLQIQTL